MKPALQDADPRRAGNAIELKLREVGQLFNSLDPSPFKEKDLDQDAEEFIVEWARELRPPKDAAFRLIVHLEKPLPAGQTPAVVQEAIRHYFAYRASINRLALRQLLHQGRTSLVIGVSFLSACLLTRRAHRAPRPPGCVSEHRPRGPHDRRVGGDVAADADLSLRLVASPTAGGFAPQAQSHARRRADTVAMSAARAGRAPAGMQRGITVLWGCSDRRTT